VRLKRSALVIAVRESSLAVTLPTRRPARPNAARHRLIPSSRRTLDCAAPSRTGRYRQSWLRGVSWTWYRWFDSSPGRHSDAALVALVLERSAANLPTWPRPPTSCRREEAAFVCTARHASARIPSPASLRPFVRTQLGGRVGASRSEGLVEGGRRSQRLGGAPGDDDDRLPQLRRACEGQCWTKTA